MSILCENCEKCMTDKVVCPDCVEEAINKLQGITYEECRHYEDNHLTGDDDPENAYDVPINEMKEHHYKYLRILFAAALSK